MHAGVHVERIDAARRRRRPRARARPAPSAAAPSARARARARRERDVAEIREADRAALGVDGLADAVDYPFFAARQSPTSPSRP